MGYASYDKKEPKKERHFVFHVSIKEVEKTDDSATEKTIRTITSMTVTDHDIFNMLRTGKNVLSLIESSEYAKLPQEQPVQNLPTNKI